MPAFDRYRHAPRRPFAVLYWFAVQNADLPFVTWEIHSVHALDLSEDPNRQTLAQPAQSVQLQVAAGVSDSGCPGLFAAPKP